MTLIFLAYSFIELIKQLFKIQRVNSFLSFSRPTGEGRQLQRGAVHENPTVAQFLVNNQALRVVDSIRIETSQGYTRGTNTSDIIVKLPRCHRKTKENNTSKHQIEQDTDIKGKWIKAGSVHVYNDNAHVQFISVLISNFHL